MTAVALFDHLAREGAAPDADNPLAPQQLAQLASKLVSAALEDVERVRAYEAQTVACSSPGRPRDLGLLRTIWRLYFEWANDAEDVLTRARSMESRGIRVEGTARLDDAIGKIRARLSLTPKQTLKSMEQARQGQFVPAKELRDELHARLRA